MTIRRFAHPLAIALSVGAINYAFVPRASRPTTRTSTVQTLRTGVNGPRDVRQAAAAHTRPATLGASPAESPDLLTWWLPVAELAVVGAYLEVAASHWRGLTLGADDGPSDS